MQYDRGYNEKQMFQVTAFGVPNPNLHYDESSRCSDLRGLASFLSNGLLPDSNRGNLPKHLLETIQPVWSMELQHNSIEWSRL
ncbi:MAG: hypothetical protein DHS20C11_11300 [Lysobacteraceae bacterium]|nr:MAG: hypothetical protein DHS20C11_11300 [Xanthomonadaceae bacterium]